MAKFLDGRTIKVGETIRLPAEFTKKMLAGWDESMAALPIDVILMGTEHVHGQVVHFCTRCLPPRPTGRRASTDRRQVPHRARHLPAGHYGTRRPVAATERHGEPGEEFDVRRKGKLQVAVHVEHGRAAAISSRTRRSAAQERALSSRSSCASASRYCAEKHWPQRAQRSPR